jgi:threonylcarbamoyladenosine tRNA methylthiotransferase MtaB
VAVIGCYAQLQSEQIAAISGVDLVLGSQDKFSLLDFIGSGTKKTQADVFVSCIENNEDFISASSAGFNDRTRAFLKVQDGCDFHCAYCTVPIARGKSRSTTTIEILLQAREAVEKGHKEIVLTGVNVGDYGKKHNANLLMLLKQLVTVDGLMRIRISSIEPNLLTDELLDFWFTEDKLCNHWHIPLQSGSDAILRRMSRRYLTSMFTNRVERIKSIIPSAGIGTDVIVGFPGESDVLFEDTDKYLNDLPITYLHVFSYSERPNTPSAAFDQQVDPRIKAERSKKLRLLSLHKRKMFYESFVGKTIPVLFESVYPDGKISGLTGEYVRVDVNEKRNLSNKIINVRVEEALAEKCIGKISEPSMMPAIRVAI